MLIGLHVTITLSHLLLTHIIPRVLLYDHLFFFFFSCWVVIRLNKIVFISNLIIDVVTSYDNLCFFSSFFL